VPSSVIIRAARARAWNFEHQYPWDGHGRQTCPPPSWLRDPPLRSSNWRSSTPFWLRVGEGVPWSNCQLRRSRMVEGGEVGGQGDLGGAGGVRGGAGVISVQQ